MVSYQVINLPFIGIFGKYVNGAAALGGCLKEKLLPSLQGLKVASQLFLKRRDIKTFRGTQFQSR